LSSDYRIPGSLETACPGCTAHFALSSTAVPGSCIFARATAGGMPDIVLGEARCPHCGLRVFFSIHDRAALCQEMPEWDSRPFEEEVLEISPQRAYLDWWKETISNKDKGVFRMVTSTDPLSPSMVLASVCITKGSLMGIEGCLIRITSTTARVLVTVEGVARLFDVPCSYIKAGERGAESVTVR